MRYRRAHMPGGTYFFTVNLADRSADFLVRHIDDLRAVMTTVKQRHPFKIVAMVVLTGAPARRMALTAGRCRLPAALVAD